MTNDCGPMDKKEDKPIVLLNTLQKHIAEGFEVAQSLRRKLAIVTSGGSTSKVKLDERDMPPTPADSCSTMNIKIKSLTTEVNSLTKFLSELLDDIEF